MAIDTAVGRANAAAGYIAAVTHASLHTANPNGTGAGEVTGGSPAYARLPVTWTNNGGGNYTSQILEFNVPPNTTLTHVGLWTALTGGTYIDKSVVAATFVSQGQLRIVLTYQES